MTRLTKGLASAAIVLVAAGAVVLSAGSIAYQASRDEPDADIGAGIALITGPYVVGAGLLLGAAAAISHFAGRRGRG
ncbi:MAG TPA: hypothetical protein VJX66_00905 [Amycolatopsis sp.]|nr:hypothetical protein [Amycolatopsis sp.]